MRALAVTVLFLALAAHAHAITPSAAIVQVFGTHAPEALRVARCESGLNARATGNAGERGVFQIHPVHFGSYDKNRLWQPLYNARVAYRISKGGTNWEPWTCRP